MEENVDRTYKRTYKAEFYAEKWTYVDLPLHDSTLVCIIIMDCCRMDSVLDAQNDEELFEEVYNTYSLLRSKPYEGANSWI